MNEDKDFLGAVAPFGDETEVFPCEMYLERIEYRKEKGYEKLCRGCEAVTPEMMKDYIPEDVRDYDEPYYCYWCGFIRVTGIDSLLVSKKKEESTKGKKVKYEEEDDGFDAMWELEDSGAFADEGIMPGCHSRYWEYKSEAEDIMQEFRDMEFVGLCIKLAREKAGLSIEALADKLDIPESFIKDIEDGEYINFYSNKSADSVPRSGCPVSVVMPAENNNCIKAEEERAWWQDCGDGRIKEKVADYLCGVLNPDTAKGCDKDNQSKVADSDDGLPF